MKRRKTEEFEKPEPPFLFGQKKTTILFIAAFIVFVASGLALYSMLSSPPSPADTVPTQINSSLIEFYGKECPHCAAMAPIVLQVEQEQNVTFSKLEVWHNTGNQKIMQAFSDVFVPICGGDLAVPAFYNNKTGKALCGEVGKEELAALTQGS